MKKILVCGLLTLCGSVSAMDDMAVVPTTTTTTTIAMDSRDFQVVPQDVEGNAPGAEGVWQQGAHDDGSMATHVLSMFAGIQGILRRLAARVGRLETQLSGLEWRVAVVSWQVYKNGTILARIEHQHGSNTEEMDVS